MVLCLSACLPAFHPFYFSLHFCLVCSIFSFTFGPSGLCSRSVFTYALRQLTIIGEINHTVIETVSAAIFPIRASTFNMHIAIVPVHSHFMTKYPSQYVAYNMLCVVCKHKTYVRLHLSRYFNCEFSLAVRSFVSFILTILLNKSQWQMRSTDHSLEYYTLNCRLLINNLLIHFYVFFFFFSLFLLPFAVCAFVCFEIVYLNDHIREHEYVKLI